MSKHTLTSLSFLLAMPCTMAAATEIEVLPEVTITASRTVKPAVEVPYHTTIITEEALINNSVRSIPEALEFTPGVLVQKTTTGHGSPVIRGFTGRQNLLMLDGVRLNNSSWRSGPVQYWNTLDVFSISRMELVRSQGSVMYGSDAAGGTMNLISKSAPTKNFDDGTQFFTGEALYRFSTQGASHVGHLEANVGVGQRWGLHLGMTGGWYGDISAPKMGTMKKTGYDQLSGNLRLDYHIDKENTITFATRGFSQDDIWRQHQTTYFEPWHGTTLASPRTSNIYDQSNAITYLKAQGTPTNSWCTSYTATVSYVVSKEKNYVRSLNTSSTDDTTLVNTLGVDLQFNSQLGEGTLTYGTDYYQDWISSKRISTTAAGVSARQIQGPLPTDTSYQLYGLFTQYMIPVLSKSLELTGGARYTYAHADIGRYSSGEGAAASASRHWNDLALAAQTLYKVTPASNVYFSVGQAFRAPNADDLATFAKVAQSGTVNYGNTNLRPEQFLTYELGTHINQGASRSTISAYITQVNDLILGVPITQGSTNQITTNAGKGWIWGFEVATEYDFSREWTAGLFGSFVDGVVETPDFFGAPTANSSAMSKMMPMTMGTNVRWTSPSKNFRIEMRAKFVRGLSRLSPSDRADTSRIPPSGTPGYAAFDIDFGYTINKNWEAIMSFHNFTNTSYRNHASGVNEPGFGASATLIYKW